MKTMKTIAIFSRPQECGANTLDFVSLENGQIIKTITMDGFDGWDAFEIVHHYEPISEIATFYDYCRVQRWKIHESEDYLRHHQFYNEDSTWTLGENIPVINQYPASAVWTILDCEDTGKTETIVGFGKPFVSKLWKYKAAICNTTEEVVYHPEKDVFLKSFQEETGLIWPLEDRRAHSSDTDIVNYIASKLNYEVVNTLSY